MLLTIDIGNTNVVIGCYQGIKLVASGRFDTRKTLKSSEWKKYFIKQFKEKTGRHPKEIEHICVSSVVPKVQKKFHDLCADFFKIKNPYYVSHRSKLHLEMAVEQPARVGIDRLINAAAAYHIFQQNLIVIDMGTAMTMDVVEHPGRFRGGIIFPGPNLSLQTLSEKAAQLPLVPFKEPQHAIGRNTVECMQSGVFHGYIGAIEILTKKFELELNKKMIVVATGGLSGLFASVPHLFDHYEKDLTLTGLRLIYEWNLTPPTPSC